MTSTRKLTKADFKVPALLIALSIVPTLGGIMRLVSMTDGRAVTEENARFVHSPTPFIVHGVCATLYCILGAFQFGAAFRVRWPRWHRLAGRVLAVCGLVAAATGLWMTMFYAIPVYHQGPLTYGVRLIVGTAMFASIVIAWRRILQRDVASHEAFMIRAYALGQGAGTQVLVLGPWTLLTGESEGFTRDVLLSLSWAINAVIAELIIRRRKQRVARGRVPAMGAAA